MQTTETPSLMDRIMSGPLGVVLALAIPTVAAVLMRGDPRSLPGRLLLMLGIFFIFSMRQPFWLRAVLAAVVLVGLIPFFGITNPFLLEIGFQVFLFATLALGLNIVVGFAGLLDLGYVAFFAVGAYLWAFFGSQQIWHLDEAPGTFAIYPTFPFDASLFWVFIIAGIVAAAGAGLMLGMPVLRLRGDYLAIVTLGFGEVIRVLVNNLDKPVNLTNGPQGITPIQRPPLPDWLANDTVYGFLGRFSNGRTINENDVYGFFFYFLALVVLIVSILLIRRLNNSRTGRGWNAIREDDIAAQAMGVPLVRNKLMAFAIGASFSGAMGVLYAANRTFVSPESFSLTQSISILTMVILGGLGSIPGVVVGAAIVTLLQIDILQTLSQGLSSLRQSDQVIPLLNMPWADLPSQLDPARYQRLVFGIILILMMIFRQEGIIPARRPKMEVHDDALTGSSAEQGGKR
jgi:branched-chain amino acid transport system permease protein